MRLPSVGSVPAVDTINTLCCALREEENSRILPMEEATEEPGHFSNFLPDLKEGSEFLRSAHSGLGPEALSFFHNSCRQCPRRFSFLHFLLPALSPPPSFINLSPHQSRFIVGTEQRGKWGPRKGNGPGWGRGWGSCLASGLMET